MKNYESPSYMKVNEGSEIETKHQIPSMEIEIKTIDMLEPDDFNILIEEEMKEIEDA